MAAATIALVGGTEAYGQNVTWNAASTATVTWSNAAIWSGGQVPTAANNVVLTGSAATLTINSAAVANSIDWAAATNQSISIADGGSLAVAGAVSRSGVGLPRFTLLNSSSANAATVFTASALFTDALTVGNAASRQYFTTSITATVATIVTIGNASGTAIFRQTGGDIYNPSVWGVALMASTVPTPTGTAFYVMDGGILRGRRIGTNTLNGNNNNLNQYASNGVFQFNSGTVQNSTVNNLLTFENAYGFLTYAGSGTKDMGFTVSRPVRVELASGTASEFNADGASGRIVFTPSSVVVDKAGEQGTIKKTGLGTLMFNGDSPVATNTWTGDTTATSGTLSVDYSYIAGTATSGSTRALADAYSPASRLVLDGGNFSLVGRANAAGTTLTNLTLTAAPTVTVSSTAGLVIGQEVTNANLPAGTYIRSFPSATSIQLSAFPLFATGSQTGQTLTFASASFTNSQTINDVLLKQNSTVTVNNAGNSTLLTFGAVSGTAGLTKAGAGSLRITGASDYQGATTVSAGMFIVDGTLADTSAVTVSSGAMLGGSGLIQSLVTVSGTLAPGNSPGVLSVDSLLLQSTATTLMEINGLMRGTDYDGITISDLNGLTYGGTLSFVFGNASPLDGAVFDLFAFAGAPSGSFTNVVSSGFYAGTWTNNNDGTFELVQDGQTLTFSQATGDIVVVPEPASWLLAAIGTACIGWSARRRVLPA